MCVVSPNTQQQQFEVEDHHGTTSSIQSTARPFLGNGSAPFQTPPRRGTGGAVHKIFKKSDGTSVKEKANPTKSLDFDDNHPYPLTPSSKKTLIKTETKIEPTGDKDTLMKEALKRVSELVRDRFANAQSTDVVKKGGKGCRNVMLEPIIALEWAKVTAKAADLLDKDKEDFVRKVRDRWQNCERLLNAEAREIVKSAHPRPLNLDEAFLASRKVIAGPSKRFYQQIEKNV